MSDWWLSRSSGAPEGPFPTDVLAEGLSTQQIPHQAYVCRVGDQRWLRISQVDEICRGTLATTRQPPPAVSSSELSRQVALPQNPTNPALHNDIDDEDNERTQIITAQPGAPTPGTVARATLTPLPSLPILPSGRSPLPSVTPPVPTRAASAPQGRPLQPPQAASQGRSLLTPPIGSAAGPRPASPLVPTLSGSTSDRNQTSGLDVSITSPKEPYRAKVPTLEGIHASPSSPESSPAAAATPGDPNPTAASTGLSVRSSLGGTEALRQPIRPQPSVPPGAYHSGQQTGAPTGLASLGLAPLGKASGQGGPIQGLTPLVAPSPTAEVPAPRGPTIPASRSPVVSSAAAPGLLAFLASQSPPARSAPGIDNVQRVAPQSLAAGPLGAAEGNYIAPDGPGLEDADGDDVTTIATSALAALSSPPLLAGGFDDEETQIVPQAQLPQGLSQPATVGVKPPLVPRSGSGPSAASSEFRNGLGQSNTGALGALDFSKRRVDVELPRQTQTPALTRTNQADRQAANPILPDRSAMVQETKPLPIAPLSPAVASVELAPSPPPDDFDPSELMEVETDDPASIPRMHSAPPFQPNASQLGNVAHQAPANPVRPIISQPPKAIHQPLAPSVVLNAEPVVHQEATRPAVRALKQPGVIQITYGTLVVFILGIALLVLIIVLVLKA